jgi:dihydrofolate reductase
MANKHTQAKMRKIKLQMQITLDGFVCGANGEMDWMLWDWDEVLRNYVIDLTNSADTILLGRKTGEGMAVYWPTVASNPESKEEDLFMADKLSDTAKVVFSKTVSAINWTNVRVAGNIAEEVKKLKQQPGRDILIYGGAGIVASFIKENLIDEYHLFLNPTAIGNGKPIFSELDDTLKLKLVKSTTSSVGIVVLFYEQER